MQVSIGSGTESVSASSFGLLLLAVMKYFNSSRDERVDIKAV
jgi:hypothetical protein